MKQELEPNRTALPTPREIEVYREYVLEKFTKRIMRALEEVKRKNR